MSQIEPQDKMKQSHNPQRGIHRRDMIKGTAAAGLAFTAGFGGASQGIAATPAGENPIPNKKEIGV